ncbi:glycogen synthase GlgA [Photobacterium profundum]|uniref:Glycogen synthase n=1 Tax=Photobacterium profundum (strain SS9) TaxID=298386 RepID=GLGA_PHOPR|nr:glycogen synthase GlgA [Photobacterium profundum]Q6LKA1.1 RecName: Full=Glycogen synthase; AltName: Full=Starch [bacterial glycogen] synthase [Photobacterium profundum SS9]CAG22279.1 putative glycogen synthase [Photobacterium profundum SS9]
MATKKTSLTKHPLKILFVSSEVEGFAKTGGLADVAKSLPAALKKMGHDVRIVMPFYQTINGKDNAVAILSTELLVESQPFAVSYQVMQLDEGNVPVYALDAPQYYDRPELYAENNQAYADNGERFTFLSAASLDLCEKLGFQPDVIHCNDWHTGLIPFLLKTRYAESDFFAKSKSVITIHNAVFKGVFNYDQYSLIPELIQRRYINAEMDPSHISMLKAGVAYADKVNAVSPNYASELLTHLGSHGMEADFQNRAKDLYGIINGCDYDDWNPETDVYIKQKFKANKVSLARGKKACRRDLQKQVNLPEVDVPVYGMVCRLTEQKGLHYLIPVLEDFLLNDVQVVIVGTGDPTLASALRDISEQHSDKFAFVETYSNPLAHCVEAGVDFFMMPSEFEPCGLNQMYSLAYGTLPIVRSVGGLKDTVIDYDQTPQVATGFIYDTPTPEALLIKLQRSLLLYCQRPQEFKRLQQNAMACKFNWDESAEQYLDMYLGGEQSLVNEICNDKVDA